MSWQKSIEKVILKSKHLLFDANRSFKQQMNTCVPYEQTIVVSEMYPEKIFLVHKNMIFNQGTICNSSFSVYSFDMDGNFIQTEDDITDKEFFRTMQVVKEI